MKPVSRLRIVLTVILWIIAVLSVLWAFVPSFRVSTQNAWLRATGRDSAPAGASGRLAGACADAARPARAASHLPFR